MEIAVSLFATSQREQRPGLLGHGPNPNDGRRVPRPSRNLRIAVVVAIAALGLVGAWALFTLGPHGELACQRTENPRCREASGRVLYVEAVDPDGDGDSHLVLASRQSLTWPGVTIVVIPPRTKQRASTPHFGQWVSAIGLPNTGSHGETTLNALQLELR